MNAIVQLGDSLVSEESPDFKPYKLRSGADYFPGMGITYLDKENMPLLLLPKDRVSTALKVVLLTFTVFNYCKDEKGIMYDHKLLTDTLVNARELVEVMYTLDGIYLSEMNLWEINQDFTSVVSVVSSGELEDLLVSEEV